MNLLAVRIQAQNKKERTVEDMEVNRNFFILEKPWTKYRLLLKDIASQLKLDQEEEEHFKVLIYRSIPTPSLVDGGVDVWIRKMEQRNVISIDKLDVFNNFFKSKTEMLLRIRKFQQYMRTIRLLTADLEDDEWLFSPPIEWPPFEIPWDLQELLEKWHKRLDKKADLSWFDINDIYSLATQRMRSVMATEPMVDLRQLSLQAIAIADFLIQELSEWFLEKSDQELMAKFRYEIVRLHREL